MIQRAREAGWWVVGQVLAAIIVVAFLVVFGLAAARAGTGWGRGGER